jgi:hypothetical protein
LRAGGGVYLDQPGGGFAAIVTDLISGQQRNAIAGSRLLGISPDGSTLFATDLDYA